MSICWTDNLGDHQGTDSRRGENIEPTVISCSELSQYTFSALTLTLSPILNLNEFSSCPDRYRLQMRSHNKETIHFIIDTFHSPLIPS